MNIAVKKVVSKGRRYAYIRGTDIALVTGFVGTEDQFDSELARAISAASGTPVKSVFDGFRYDAAKAMHRSASGRAREIGRPYSLSAESIHQMLLAGKDRCQLTGIAFTYRGNADQGVRVRPMAPSIDRIDNKSGYKPDNVRIVLTCVNIALNEWGIENFENICRAFLGNLENRRDRRGKQTLPDAAKCIEIKGIRPAGQT